MVFIDSLTINGQPLAHTPLTAGDYYEWQPLEIACRPDPAAVDVRLRIGDNELGPPSVILGDGRWRWRWNPEHAVGHYTATLDVAYAERQLHSEAFSLRILPAKLDIAQYEALLQDLGTTVRAIVYAVSGGRTGALLERGSRQTLVEELFALVDGLVDEALAVTRLIDRRPHATLTTRPGEVPLGEVARLDGQALSAALRGQTDEVDDDVVPELQAALRPPGQKRGGPLPRSVPTRRSDTTTDTPEHRMLRGVLRTLQWRVGFVREVARREHGRRRRNAPLVENAAAEAALDAAIERCNHAARALRNALALPWLSGAGELTAAPAPTALMRREPRYRRLYELYRRLRTTPFLAFDCPALWLPIQELPALYEQWCVLQTVRALLPLGRLVDQQLVEAGPDPVAREQRWTLRLAQGKPLLTVALPDGAQAVLWYQRRYAPAAGGSLGAVDPFVRVPDVAIELLRPGVPPRVLIFDAKYRVAPGGGVPQPALDDAYAYRSAIGIDGVRATLGAFLLFPGSVPLQTQDRVGALPLVPDAPNTLDALLRELLAP